MHYFIDIAYEEIYEAEWMNKSEMLHLQNVVCEINAK
jgi:hypothetical protein